MPGTKTLSYATAGILQMQAQLYGRVAQNVIARWGAAGGSVIKGALENYGGWRGGRLRSRHLARGIELNAGNLVLYWDNCDVYLARARIRSASRVAPGAVQLSVVDDPFTDYLDGAQAPDLAELYYRSALPAMARSYDPTVTMNLERCDRPPKAPVWTFRWASPSDRSTALESTEPAPDIRTIVKTSANLFGGLYYFLGSAILDRLELAGEEVLRESIRQVGRDRGLALREAHLAKGLPINLQSLLQNYDSPIAAAFEWADGGVLTPERWHQDCTYCPFHDVWQELDGERLGWIYDDELHPALNQAYHPGVTVKFVSNKNLGDKVCGFRFDLMEGEAPKRTLVERQGRAREGWSS